MRDDCQATRRQLLGCALGLAGAAVAPKAFAASNLAGIARSELQRVGAAVTKRDVVGVVDFNNPSRTPRFHLINMETGKVDSLLVSHGRGSDPGHSGWVKNFSNAFGSNASSDGAYVTGGYYVGQHGRSMNLRGLDRTNNNAEPRRIVVHSAAYVSPSFAKAHGVLGRSEGCFAVDRADLDQVLTRLGPGRLLVAGKFQA